VGQISDLPWPMCGLHGWVLIYRTADVPRRLGWQRFEASEFQITPHEIRFSLFRESVALPVPPLGLFGLI
jgi:hypothetical protein